MELQNNILNSGVEKLIEMKETMLQLYESKSKSNSLKNDEEKLEKSIQNTEKSIDDEINSTIKKRRREIEETYDEQVDKIKTKIKKTKDKRDKRKNCKVSERIQEETASLRELNGKLGQEAKQLFHQNKVPGFCNTKLFYALYVPNSFEDILIILGAILSMLLILPTSIYFLLNQEENIVSLIIIYFITALLTIGGYVLIGNKTKEKHRETVQEVKQIRVQIKENKKKIAVIRKKILKDRDESNYGLESFDEEIASFEREITGITEQKNEALSVFDNTTSHIIASEIRTHHEEELSGLIQDFEKLHIEAKKADERVNELTFKLANNYEPYIGKDFMTVDKLDALINIIKAGTANTISEAISFYKHNMN